MSVRHWSIVALLAVGAALVYLRNPPWIEDVTSGMKPWDHDESGVLYRWTEGHASFYIPSNVHTMTIPMRSAVATEDHSPVKVEFRQDGAILGIIELPTPAAWVTSTLTLRSLKTRRPFQRIDLRVSRTFPPWSFGVMTGVVEVR
jgi:hypothetical protein